MKHATRKAGLQALEDFLPRAGRAYASSRNYDFGPGNQANVSRLSPYTRYRLVTEAEIVARVLERHAPSTAEKFIQEVCWRTYFKGWLERRPSIWADYLSELEREHARLRSDSKLAARYERAIEGGTGFDCFDGWTRELMETGYLHNHARMWFASIWIFTLELPWQLGASHFYHHLIDGDPASNTLSWRWVGGRHTIGKTYLARKDNIARYTNGRFEAAEGLAEAAPAPEEVRHPPSAKLQAADTPAINTRALVLIGEDDCTAEDWPIERVDVVGVAGLLAADHDQPRSDRVDAFRRAAIANGVARAASHYDCKPTDNLANGDNATALFAPCETLQLGNAAGKLGATSIVTMRPPVGPGRAVMDAAIPHFETAGLKVIQMRRAWDDAFWAHSTAGFFKIKQKIPSLLAELDIAR